MKPKEVSTGNVPRVSVIPDEGKVFEAAFLAKTFRGLSADFVKIDEAVACRIKEGEEDALEELLLRDPDNPYCANVQADKVQLHCLDGMIRYIANRRIFEVHD